MYTLSVYAQVTVNIANGGGVDAEIGNISILQIKIWA